MKRSIAKYILGVIVIVTLAMVGFMIAFEADEATTSAYDTAKSQTFGAAKALSMSYSTYGNDALFDNINIESALSDDMRELLNDYGLLFVYVVVPDEQTTTLNYLYIEGASGTEKTISEIKSQPVQKRNKLSSEILKVMSGSSKRETLEIDNQFGHVYTTYVPLTDSQGNITAVVGAEMSVSSIQDMLLRDLPIRIFVVFFVGLVCALPLFFIFRKKVINPIRSIKDAMDSFGKSENYDTPKLDIQSSDEFSLIGDSFNNMAKQIRENVIRIREFKDLQSKQEAELKAAAKIQEGFIPDGYFESETLKVSGSMIPAKEVGGDFYDYFEHDGKTIAVIADVSGKGLSASIFMAGTICLIRAFVRKGLSPDEVLRAVNIELAKSNPNMMFVTVFLAFIDCSNGRITYCNAGHNSPYLIYGNKLETLQDARSMPLGIFEEEPYKKAEIVFPLSATLFLYTDGVNEAFNDRGEFYGTERLECCLTDCKNEEFTASVMDDLQKFVDGYEQSDDTTMLALTFKSEALQLSAKTVEFEKLRRWIFDNPNIPDDAKNEICLIAEEVFVNISSYAYDDGGDVTIRMMVQGDRCLLQVSDSGKPFNPSKDIIEIEDYRPFEQVGGLGRFVVNNICDNWEYHNLDGINISLLIKKF